MMIIPINTNISEMSHFQHPKCSMFYFLMKCWFMIIKDHCILFNHILQCPNIFGIGIKDSGRQPRSYICLTEEIFYPLSEIMIR